MPRRRLVITMAVALTAGLLWSGSPVTAGTPPQAGATQRVDDCPEPDVFCDFGVPYGPRDIQTLDVIVPAAMDGAPSVIVIHGGGWTGGTSEKLRSQSIYFAQNGLASFSINYTLSTALKPSWPQAFVDVKLAARWIKGNASTYGADGTRLAAFGGSAGGHLATLLDTAAPPASSPVTAVAWSGPMELRTGFSEAQPKQQGTVRRFLGCVPNEDGSADPDFCQNNEDLAASPARHVTADDGPVLFFNSPNEIVPLDSALLMDQALADAGVPHLFVETTGAKHSVVYQCDVETVLGVSAPVIDGTVRWLSRALTGQATRPTGTFCP